jgi:hypothetical protein
LTGEGAPHPTDWVVFWDGEEVACGSTRDDIAPAVLAVGFELNPVTLSWHHWRSLPPERTPFCLWLVPWGSAARDAIQGLQHWPA